MWWLDWYVNINENTAHVITLYRLLYSLTCCLLGVNSPFIPSRPVPPPSEMGTWVPCSHFHPGWQAVFRNLDRFSWRPRPPTCALLGLRDQTCILTGAESRSHNSGIDHSNHSDTFRALIVWMEGREAIDFFEEIQKSGSLTFLKLNCSFCSWVQGLGLTVVFDWPCLSLSCLHELWIMHM